MTEDQNQHKSKVRTRSIIKLVLLMVVVLPLTIMLLLQFPSIQNWVGSQIVNRLSKSLETKVSVEKVNFSITRGVVLESFYVENLEGDTLVYLGDVSSNLKQNLGSLISNKLLIETLNANNVHLHLITERGDSLSNLQKLLNKLSSKKTSNVSNSSNFVFGINELNLNGLSFSKKDENKGSEMRLDVRKSRIVVDTLDFANNHLAFDEVIFDRPQVSMVFHPVEELEVKKKRNEEQDSIITNNEELIEIHKFKLLDGKFDLENLKEKRKERPVDAIDYNYLSLRELNIETSDFKLVNGNQFLAQIDDIHFRESNGFEVESLQVESFHFSDQKTEMQGFSFKTKESTIKDKIIFKYNELSDFKDFSTAIKLDINFDGSSLSIYDLCYFFPDIYNSDFFRKNYHRSFKISGKFKGTTDRLSANDLSISIDDLLNYNGRFSFRNLTDIENATISFKLEELQSSIPNLRAIIPRFNPPENFDLLGDIVYKGRFSGSVFDFVSFGTVNTALGLVDLDLRMDLKDGTENANYFGSIDLQEFDLKTWSGNDNFDKISLFAEINNGRGLKLDNAFADLNAELIDFSYKGYSYENVAFDGKIDKSKLNGVLEIADKNVDLDFDGNLDFTRDIMVIDFKSNIRKLDLKAINLSPDYYNFEGNLDVELIGSDIDDFIGVAEVRNIIARKDTQIFKLDSIVLNSEPIQPQGRLVELDADILHAKLNGQFNFEDIAEHFKNYLHENYSAWAKKIQIPQPTKLENDQIFTLDLQLIDSKSYLSLAGVEDLTIQGLELNINADLPSGRLDGAIHSDTIQYKNVKAKDFDFDMNSKTESGHADLKIHQLSLGNRKFTPIQLLADLYKENGSLEVKTENIIDSLGVVDFIVNVEPVVNGFNFELSEKQWEMLGTNWEFSQPNQFRLLKDEINIENLVLSDGKRSLVFNDINNKGLHLDFNDFDFLLIDQIINYDKIEFAGEGDLQLSYSNIFDKGDLELEYTIPDFTLNGDSYGMLKLLASSIEKDVLGVVLRIYRADDGQDIKVEGVVNTKTEELDAELIASKFDLRLFEYIINDGISLTTGTAQVDARVKGKLNDPKMYGEAILNDGGTRINYLGTYVSFRNQKINLTETYINLNGLTIKDRLGNSAVFSGGLNHYFLGDFTIDAVLSSNRFLALDTDKDDNPDYYGTGLGPLTIDMSGDFGSPNFLVNATAGEGSELNIPIESSESNFDESFIKFVNREDILYPKEDSLAVTQALEIEGVNFELNMTVLPEALFNIIFDERTNDVIRGRGRGDVQVTINRRGDFEVYGDYEVESGEYLFTAWGIVAKPFTIERGGTITWTGDPFNATLNINAYYEDLRAPLDVFLAEYLIANNQASFDARARTDIDLKMRITGFLYTPTIQFDMFFPELVGELKSYADSKMRTLRQNENELNDQVAGLILFGSFLPTNNGLGGLSSSGTILSGSYNTLSEMIGNQLSFFLSDILNDAFTENGLITGIDFDIGINKNAQLVDNGQSTTSLIPDEVEVHLRPKFQNDRWGIDVGTNYIRQSGSAGAIENYVVNDFVIEYFLTKDRKLKLKAYAKNDYDVFIARREQKFGVGLNYRKEFGSLSELTKQMKEDIQEDLDELDNQGGNE